MKKSIIIVLVLIIIGGIAWYATRGTSDTSGDAQNTTENTVENKPVIAPTSVVKVSDKLTEFKNEELGFSVQYPTTWTNEITTSGVVFIIPTKSAKENTVSKLQVNIDVIPGKCSFPQVTTVQQKDSIKVKDVSFNMISMSNAVQGREYFNRMYSTPKGSICYMFNFGSITSNPSSKGYTATQTTTVTANNKAIIDEADTAFKALINSFTYVVGPEGENEALHSSGK